MSILLTYQVKPKTKRGEAMLQQTVLPFKLETTAEDLTAYGGLSLLSEFNEGLGLSGLVKSHLPKPGSNRGLSPSVFVNALVLMLQGGGASLEDLRELERESGLRKLLGQDLLPKPCTVGDWLRRLGNPETGASGLHGLDRVRTILNNRQLSQESRPDYTLDADATYVESWKHDAVFSYHNSKGYYPMLGFLYETPVCLYDEFREGNVSPKTGQVSFYYACKSRMPQSKRIARYRADSASYQADLINNLEKDGVIWAVTASQDEAVKSVIASIPEEVWQEPESGCGYEIAETVHSMNETEKAFRLIIKREIRRQEDLFEDGGGQYFYHAVACNWPGKDKNAIEVLQWHNQRGQAENFNKELKHGFGLDRMPCGESYANAVFFRIGVIAYNLFTGFKALACPEAWRRHTISTFRWKLIQVAGRIVRHAGQVFLKLAVDAKRLRLFRKIRQKTFELAQCIG